MSRFAADPSAIRGAITPLITPFAPGGEVDLEAVARLVEWQLENGTHGISVGGSTGEPTAQSIQERIAVMRAAARAIDGRVPFLPGTGSARLEETLELTAEAERLGASGVLVVAPYYARPQQEGLIRWYSSVAAEFPDLPILLYNVPIRTGVDIAPQTAGTLRRAHPNIVGIKETTRDFEHVSHVFSRVRLGLHRALGDRAALLSDARAGRPRASQLRGQLRAAPRRRALRRLRGGRPRARAAPSTTSCTRSSRRPSSRSTRCRRNGSCASWGSCPRPSPASRSHRSARRRRRGSASCSATSSRPRAPPASSERSRRAPRRAEEVWRAELREPSRHPRTSAGPEAMRPPLPPPARARRPTTRCAPRSGRLPAQARRATARSAR